MQAIQCETRRKNSALPQIPFNFDVICVNICFPFIGSHIPASYLRRRPFSICIRINLCVATKGIRFSLPFAGIQPLYCSGHPIFPFLVLCCEMNMEQKKACIWWIHFVFSARNLENWVVTFNSMLARQWMINIMIMAYPISWKSVNFFRYF